MKTILAIVAILVLMFGSFGAGYEFRGTSEIKWTKITRFLPGHQFDTEGIMIEANDKRMKELFEKWDSAGWEFARINGSSFFYDNGITIFLKGKQR